MQRKRKRLIDSKIKKGRRSNNPATFPVFSKPLDKNKEICYTYDNNGNILNKCVNGADTAYVYGEMNDCLLSYDGETFEYDSMGNPTIYRDMTATWEGRRLKSLNDGVNTIEYTYNAKGLRTSKTVGGVTTTYIYDSNDRLIKEVGAKTIEYAYGADGVQGIIIDGTSYLFRKNFFGDVTHIYNGDGEVVGKYSYTAFGECSVDVDIDGIASDNPIRYRGYYYDEETNLYYLKTRYYDPEVGRFVTIDDISYLDPEPIHGLNLYAYCANNPVMNIDPNGENWGYMSTVGNGFTAGFSPIIVPLSPFGYEKRYSAGWEDSDFMIAGYLLRIGFSSFL